MSPFILVLTLLTSTASATLIADSPADPNEVKFGCAHALDGKIKLISSGREGPEFQRFTEAVKKMLEPGGLFEILGISRPYQIMQFMPGGDVNTVGSVNGLPIAHWTDGAKLARRERSGLLYEIVIPGRDEQFSFYRDDMSFEELISIFFHAVAGHSHYTVNSRFPHFRSSNRFQEAFELSDYMDKLRAQVNADEVSEWYQFLLTMSSGQDFVHKQYQTPDDLKTKPSGAKGSGFKPTFNLLQAFVANLPIDTPEWKVKMARLFEQLHRYSPGMAATKITNEGWSVLMQKILPKHTPYNSFAEVIHYCCLLHGVVSKDISNPYWLGIEAWERVYKRFLARPEIAKLETWLEKDAAFIRYATKDIIGVMDDAMFLRFALDDKWVTKENLALTRPYTEQEYEEAQSKGLQPPDPRNQKKNWPHVILSRDPERIIQALITQQTNFQFRMPQPLVTSLNENGQGSISLELNDSIGRKVALNPRTMVETLWVLSQIQSRPVSLESTVESSDPAAHHQESPHVVKKRLRVTATPMGKIQVQEVFRNGSSDPSSMPEQDFLFDPRKHSRTYVDLPEVAAQFDEMLKGFLYNLTLGQPIQEELFKPNGHLKALAAEVDRLTAGASVKMMMNLPTVPLALIEYNNFLSQRIEAALKDAIAGRSSLIRRPQGVQISVMPRIPWFQFSQDSLQRELSLTPVMPIPTQNLALGLRQVSTTFKAGDLDSVEPSHGDVGDIDWGPGPQGDGDGQGQEPGGEGPIEDGGKKLFEDISLDAYAEALEGEITLPNLRPKTGKDIRRNEDYSGRVTRQTGVRMTRQILRNAFRRGFPTIEELSNGASPFDGTGILGRGIGRLRKDKDWVVRDFAPKPSPDVNAVVFVKMDMSGSMWTYKDTAKKAIFDLRALLSRKYKNVTFKFITFNYEAFVFDDFEKFMAFQPNGGTRYARAFKKTTELHAQFPEALYDRYSVVIGDLLESFEEEERTSFEEMKAGSQFVSIIRILDKEMDWFAELSKFFKGQAEEDEYIGYVDVIPQSSYTPLIFRTAFKNEEAEAQ